MHVTALLLLAACAPTADPTPPIERPRRALIVGVDGTRADAHLAADTPAFDTLTGAATHDARTQATGDTSSGPGWAAVLSGREPAATGVTSNDVLTIQDPAIRTFPQRARDEGWRVGVTPHWIGIPPLVGEEGADQLVLGDDNTVTTTAVGWIDDDAVDLVFVHLDDVDHAGHAEGFSPDVPAYIAAIEGTDAHLGQLLDAVSRRDDADWLVIWTTDHGGEGTGHGPRVPGCEIIPQAMRADSTPVTLPATPSQLDVAPTVAAWFDLSAADGDGTSWLAPP